MIKAIREYHLTDCDLYDYLEIARIYHHWLYTELTDGTCFDVKTLTTCTVMEKGEFLVVEQSENQQKVRLDYLSAITVLTPGATFNTASFQWAHRDQTA